MVLNHKEIPLVPLDQLSSEELRTELAVACEKLQSIDYAGALMADFLQISKETYWKRLESDPLDKQKLFEEIVNKRNKDEESVKQFNLIMKDIDSILPDLQSAVKYF